MFQLQIRYIFTQIKKQQIIDSTYDQLVDRIAHNYNMKEYKNQSGLCLLQMHHQFKLFTPGDWVLDIGAGQNYAWTDLALKFIQNDQSTHKVISNDILDLQKQRNNNVFIRGDIRDNPVKTKIALELENHSLDTIFVDVSPEYTGNINGDSRQIVGMISSAMEISENFLKPGGTFVCKMLQSQCSALLDETFQIFFHERYKYVPSIMRKTSPVYFYVMKGFLMSQNYTAMNDFIRQYKGTPERKIKVVQKYQGKYVWDPVKTIKKKLLNDLLKIKNQGRPDKDIIKVFASDPYFNVQKALRLLKQIQQARKDRNGVLESKFMNQLTGGELYKNAQQFPTTADEFYQRIVEKMDEIVKQNSQKKLDKKTKLSRAPLKDDQTYMKVENNTNQAQEVIIQYLPGDLKGKYSQKLAKDEMDDQIDKIEAIHPQIKNLMSQFQQAQKQGSQKTIQGILQQSKKKYKQLSAEKLKDIHDQVQQALKNMSPDDIAQQRKLQRELQKQHMLEDREQKADRYINQRRSRRKKPLF